MTAAGEWRARHLSHASHLHGEPSLGDGLQLGDAGLAADKVLLPRRFHPQLLDKNRRDIGKISVNTGLVKDGNAPLTIIIARGRPIPGALEPFTPKWLRIG